MMKRCGLWIKRMQRLGWPGIWVRKTIPDHHQGAKGKIWGFFYNIYLYFFVRFGSIKIIFLFSFF